MKWDAPPKGPPLEQSFVDAVTAIITSLAAQQASMLAHQKQTSPREEVNNIAEMAIGMHRAPIDAAPEVQRRAERTADLINAILGRISFDKPGGMN